jgi:arabinogalactan endo-1,4-beta-galactosidase
MRLLLFCLLFSLLSCIKGAPPPPEVKPYFFIRGVDASFIPLINTYNITYTDNGQAKAFLSILKDRGINTIRIRLWNKPADIHSSLTEVMEFAQQVKANGFRFWLNFHYSDTWADPGAQSKPAAWTRAGINALKDSIYQYTRRTILFLTQNNAAPDYIQTGNEINSGFLWNEGKVNSTSDPNWSNFAGLLKEALRAVRETAPNAKTIIHFAGHDGAAAYFQQLKTFSTDYDIIGLSYYPWWHGTSIANLQQSILTLRNTFNKPVMITETAYPFTLGWNDLTNNIVGLNNQLVNGYDASPTGQARFLNDLSEIVKAGNTSDHAGICYWAPEWVAFKGNTSMDGSPWENLALFDFQFNALPGLGALGIK